MADGEIHAVEPDHDVVFVFRVYPAVESTGSGIWKWLDVEYHALHVAKKFLTYVLESVMLSVKGLPIDIRHMYETEWVESLVYKAFFG